MVTRVDSARRTSRPCVNSTSDGPLVLVARRAFDPQRVARVRARAVGEGRCAKQRAESNACGRSVFNQTPSSAARFQLRVVDVCFSERILPRFARGTRLGRSASPELPRIKTVGSPDLARASSGASSFGRSDLGSSRSRGGKSLETFGSYKMPAASGTTTHDFFTFAWTGKCAHTAGDDFSAI